MNTPCKTCRAKSCWLSIQPASVASLLNTPAWRSSTKVRPGFASAWIHELTSTELKPTHPDFEILGFPCNQFGGQEPGSNDDVQNFCQVNYGVSFPVLGKTDVNGGNVEPVWEWMKKAKPGLLGMQRIKWNFEKFLIGRDGKVVQRWASTSKPESLKATIEEELKKGAKPTPTKEAPAPTTS